MKRPWIGFILAASFAAFSMGLIAPALAASKSAPMTKAPAPTAKVKAASKVTAAPPAAGSGALQAGISNYKRGYIAKAIPFFETAVAQNPGSAEACLWLARAHQKQGKPADFQRAMAAYRKVLALSPNNLEALSNLGEMLSWDSAMRGEAVSLLKHAYDLNPSDAAVARKLSEALFWQGNSMDALRYAAPIANRYRNDRKFMTEYAQMLSATGHAEQALEIYTTALKDEVAKNVNLQLDVARALYKSGQTQKAQAAYSEIAASVTGAAAEKPDFRMSMAGLAFDLGMPADSLTWDQGLPDSMQRQKDTQLRMARALTKVYRVPEAIERFNRLYEAGLLTADEKLEFAEYLRMLNLEGDALPSPNLVENLYREAMEENPQSGDASLRMARMYAQQEGHYNDAVQYYQQALGNPALGNRESIQKEYLDFIKSDKTQAPAAEALFKQMLTETPDDAVLKAAYAEFLSWQSDRRPEALRIYVELGNAQPDSRDLWESRIEEVLKWHKPTTDLIPLYQDIVNLYPQNKMVWWTVARAYRNDKNYYPEAVETYGKLVKRFSDDATIKREWLALLLSNEPRRRENIRLLAKMVQDDPSDLDVTATYGKLLSYEHRLGEAMQAFETVLRQDPAHREALVGKGYVILWSGRKLEAKDYFADLRQKFPDDVDIAIGLAQSEKLIGRYDQALKIIREIKPLMQQTSPEMPAPSQSGSAEVLSPAYLPVANHEENGSLLQRHAVFDAPIEPVAPMAVIAQAEPVELALSVEPDAQEASITDAAVALPAHSAPYSAELKSIQSEVQALTDAVNSLKALQESAKSQLRSIEQAVKSAREVNAGEASLQTLEDFGFASESQASSLVPTSGTGGAGRGKSVGESGMRPVYGTYAAFDYDTNPLLSGLGRFRNDQLSDVEKGLINELRPMLRGGFVYSTQQGESTTTKLRNYGFPNQLSMSLTPQVRIRGGIVPTKWYIPNGVSPDDTLGLQYGFGTTIKYWDRLTLDGDIAITHFDQSGSENLTYQAQAEFAFNDAVHAKLGARRIPLYNSLLAVTGLKPSQGAFRDELVGQARENGFYAELNTHPFSQNVDWNLGYEWAFIDGEHIPTNYKNQAFTSLGYTWHLGPRHQLRAGYEFLYFGYSKNTTAGFFDTTALGTRQPVAGLRPVVLADPGYDFGGYFSPKWFVMNAIRADLRGSLFNKFLEYKVGGSLGVQNFGLGHGIDDSGVDTASMASAFDANLIMNLTDWLAAYGEVDFLDAGGQFNRWRFGGGLILRPHIEALSPVLK
jgi:tetratricopeptide (TPR) repeat protein